MTQISATISPDTRDRLERFVRARGLKKGFVIEQALTYHLRALSELSDDAVVPAKIVVSAEAGERIRERLASNEGPNAALARLFADPPAGPS